MNRIFLQVIFNNQLRHSLVKLEIDLLHLIFHIALLNFIKFFTAASLSEEDLGLNFDRSYCSEGSVIKPILAIPALAAMLITRATCS